MLSFTKKTPLNKAQSQSATTSASPLQRMLGFGLQSASRQGVQGLGVDNVKVAADTLSPSPLKRKIEEDPSSVAKKQPDDYDGNEPLVDRKSAGSSERDSDDVWASSSDDSYINKVVAMSSKSQTFRCPNQGCRVQILSGSSALTHFKRNHVAYNPRRNVIAKCGLDNCTNCGLVCLPHSCDFQVAAQFSGDTEDSQVLEY